MRLLKSLSLALLLSSGVALAQQTGAAQQAGPALPATQPSADIAALIQQLGNDNYQVRQRAYFQLRDMGKAALPALREAEKSKDVEVHERAGDLLAELETPQIPRDLPEAPQVKGGFYGNFVRSEERPGMQLLDAIENGRSIHIERSNSGIRMIVRGELHGAAATREYKAASPEELKHANPRAYQLYVDSMAMVAPRNTPNLGNAQPGMRPFILPNGRAILPVLPQPRAAAQPAPDQDLDRLQRQLFDQMAQAQLTPLQRTTVMDLLRQLRTVRVPAADPADLNKLMEEYNRRSDALRKQLRAFNLPDPGDALPPPAAARLGISINEIADGLIVTHVLPNSRAQKLGLREADIVHKINGQPITSAREMRTLLSAQSKALTIDAERNGQAIRLEEKKAAE